MSRSLRRLALALVPALLVPLTTMPPAMAAATSEPGTPTEVSSYGATDGIRLTYEPAASDADHAPTSFEVFRGTTADDLVSIGTTTSVSGYGDPFSEAMTPGSTHTYAVRALNAVGASPQSSAITVVAPSAARTASARAVIVVDSARGSSLESWLGEGGIVDDAMVTRPGYANDETGIHLSFVAPESPLSLDFKPASGERLAVGTYDLSHGTDPSQPNVSFSSNLGLACRSRTGNFVIHDIGFDTNGIVKVLDADAVFGCSYGADTTVSIRLGVPAAYAFADLANVIAPDTAVGSTRQDAVTYTNAGETSITISDVKVTPGEGSASTIWGLAGTNGCLTTLSPGQSCEVGVAATPQAVGQNLGLITFTDTTALASHTRPLLVRGVTAPGTPFFPFATRGAGAVTMHWQFDSSDANKAASSYRVLRGPDADHLTPLATVAATRTPTWTDPDTSDGTRAYAITAINDAGESAPTSPVLVDLALRAPTAVVGGATVKNTTLSWTAPTGMPPNPITGYTIFGGTSPAALSQVGTTSEPTWAGPVPAAGVHAYYAVEATTSGGNGPRSTVVDVVGTTSQLIASRDVNGTERISPISASGGEGTPLVSGTGNYGDLSVSPNGTLVAFSSIADGDSSFSEVLSLRRTDGLGSTVTAPATVEDNFAPAWSPDNRRLAYTAYRESTDIQRICTANVTATAISPTACVPNSGAFSAPSWLNASTLVVEDDSSDLAPLRKLTLAGVASPLAGTNGGYQPSVSPDGTQVAFLYPGAGDFSAQLKVVTLATGAVRILSAPSTMLFSTPSWARDGSAVYVSGWSPSESHIVKVSTNAAIGSTIVTSGATEFAVAVSTPDVTAPTGVRLNPIPSNTLASSITPSFSATDALNGIASYSLSYRRAAFNTGYSAPTVLTVTRPTAVSLARGYTYCFSVRATDRAGNTSAATPEQCTVVPLDDRSLLRSSGFAAVTSSAYYASTGARATSINQTLTRTGGTSFKQLFLVATTCSTCGTVDVMVGSVRIARVNLASASTVNKKMIPLPSFSTRSGTVVLKVVTSSKQVIIDGLGYRK